MSKLTLFGFQISIPPVLNKRELVIKSIIKISLVALFALLVWLVFDADEDLNEADWHQEYAQFIALRFLCSLCFALLCYYDFNRKDKALAIVWAASALLINPILKIHLTKTIWTCFDIGWAALTLFMLIVELPKMTASRIQKERRKPPEPMHRPTASQLIQAPPKPRPLSERPLGTMPGKEPEQTDYLGCGLAIIIILSLIFTLARCIIEKFSG